MRYFAYCRKSSEGEERQALSIPAQIDEINRVFGSTSDMEIVEWFEEKMSAKAPGRPVYAAMIKRIERGEADGIVAWHPDRLARNSVDGGWVIHLLDRRVLKDLKFVSYNYEHSPQGMFMLQIMFGQSKYYVDNLSVNVKRGLRKKISMGWHPGLAPLGYLNDKASSTIIPDPQRYDLCRRMWDLLLTGTHCPAQLHRMAQQWGLRTPLRPRSGGGPIALATIYRMFSNPFYSGVIVSDGEWHAGKHAPMVTLEEFNRVQALIGKIGYAKPKTNEFAFTGGVIQCACGLSITAEEKRKPSGRRYVYYHCTRRLTPRCDEPAVRAEVIEEEISAFLRALRCPEQTEQWFEASIAGRKHDITKGRKLQASSAARALSDTEEEMRVLLDLRTRKLIDDAEFLAKRQRIQVEALRLRDTLREFTSIPDDRLELCRNIITFRRYAADWFRVGSRAEKRLILETVGSNCTLRAGKLSIQAKFPFEELTNDPHFLIWSGRVEHIGTHTVYRDDFKQLKRAVQFLQDCAETRSLGKDPPYADPPAERKKPKPPSVHDVRRDAARKQKEGFQCRLDVP